MRSPRPFGAAAKAGIDELARRKRVKRGAIIPRVFASPARRRFEAKAEPGKVACNRRFVSRLATRAIQVFNAQEQAAVQVRGDALVAKRRIGMAEVQEAVRRRGEAQDRRNREDVGAHGQETDA